MFRVPSFSDVSPPCYLSSPVAEQTDKDRGYESERELLEDGVQDSGYTLWLHKLIVTIKFTHQVDRLRTCGLFLLVLHRPSHRKPDFWAAQALESDSKPEQSKTWYLHFKAKTSNWWKNEWLNFKLHSWRFPKVNSFYAHGDSFRTRALDSLHNVTV